MNSRSAQLAARSFLMIIQLTGLSGSGKTTLSLAVQNELGKKGIAVEVIDGDVYRQTICKDLGFTREDRMENIRRLGSVANAMDQQDKIVIIAAINPFEKSRKEITSRYLAKTVWIYCPLDILFERDTKGLYHRAQLPDHDENKIRNLTGVNDAYEEPITADMVINTAELDLRSATDKFIRFIFQSMKCDSNVSVPFYDTM